MAAAAVTLYLLNLLLLLGFHGINRQNSILTSAVSDYGLGPTAGLFRVYLVVGSLAAVLLAMLFWRSDAPVFPKAVPACLLAMAATRAGLAVFPTDAPGQPTTRRGRIHLALAIAVFTFAYMTIAKATPLMPGFSGSLRGLQLVAMVGLAAVVVTMAPPLRRLFGLAERVFLFSTALWFLVAALAFCML